jgi:hypothetical protein
VYAHAMGVPADRIPMSWAQNRWVLGGGVGTADEAGMTLYLGTLLGIRKHARTRSHRPPLPPAPDAPAPRTSTHAMLAA